MNLSSGLRCRRLLIPPIATLFALSICCAMPALSQTVTFSPPSVSPTQAGPAAATAGDFNGDGIADLALSEAGSGGVGTIAILIGKKNGTFNAPVNYPVLNGCAVGLLMVSDFNSDQNQDLLAICEGGNAVYVYPGNGDGTFGTPAITQLPEATIAGTLIFAALGFGAVVGDFNGDGKPDLVVMLATTAGDQATMFLGNGDGTFHESGVIDSGTDILGIAAGDFNGDQNLDLALLTFNPGAISQTLQIELGNGDGTFQSGASYPWSGAAFQLTAADVNGDGNLDLMAAGITFTDFSNNIGSSGNLSDVPLSSVSVLLGDGKGNFQPGFTAPEPAGDLTGAFCLANLRGQGPIDLLEFIAIYDASGSTVSLEVASRNNDGMGGFPNLTSVTTIPATAPLAAVCADLNGDGLTDAAYTGVPASTLLNLVNNENEDALNNPSVLPELLSQLTAGSLFVSLNNTAQSAPPDTPAIAVSGGVLNGASFQPGIAAGSWMTINGTNLSTKADTWSNAIVNGALPTTLDGVSVMVGDQPAYVEYVSTTQINALAPSVPAGTVPVTVTTSNGTSPAVMAQVSAEQPAFFQWGTYAVATRQNFSLAVKNGTFPGATTVPAKPGDVIILWGTGFGPTSPAAPAGAETPSTTTYNTATAVSVTVGGKPATVYGAALAPGYAGLYQIAIQIPALANGDYPVVATINGAQSLSTTMITVQQ